MVFVGRRLLSGELRTAKAMGILVSSDVLNRSESKYILA